MITLYILAKIVHIVSIIFFIGVVSFRTFIIPVLKDTFDKSTFKQINQLTGLKARGIIKINNIFLLISGFYLLSFYLETVNILLHIKVTIGFLLVILFYITPRIMNRFIHIPWFNMTYHYVVFSTMIIVVILSQVMFG